MWLAGQQWRLLHIALTGCAAVIKSCSSLDVLHLPRNCQSLLRHAKGQAAADWDKFTWKISCSTLLCMPGLAFGGLDQSINRVCQPTWADWMASCVSQNHSNNHKDELTNQSQPLSPWKEDNCCMHSENVPQAIITNHKTFLCSSWHM